jgi:hypothetical protein
MPPFSDTQDRTGQGGWGVGPPLYAVECKSVYQCYRLHTDTVGLVGQRALP